ncbi:MAG: hypothetical protein EBQ86_11385 [Betaproteobacteria bacterium]|nr:hypothetical protein [Betaproteobacteria bacterium]
MPSPFTVTQEDTVVEGLERAPEAFIALFRGANIGKMLVRVAAIDEISSSELGVLAERGAAPPKLKSTVIPNEHDPHDARDAAALIMCGSDA